MGATPKMVGKTQQTHGVFPQKTWSALGVEIGGYHHLRKHPYVFPQRILQRVINPRDAGSPCQMMIGVYLLTSETQGI